MQASTSLVERPQSPLDLGTPRREAMIAVLGLLALFAGCGDDATRPGPPAPGSPQAVFQATLHPGGSSFVLARVPGSRPGQTPVDVDLLGSNLVVEPATETVSLDVAMRNASQTELPAPAQMWLSDFDPAGIEVLNADFIDPPWRPNEPVPGTGDRRFGFDYSSQVGPDGLLSPGETSQSRTWQFRVPGLESFAFAAVATFGGKLGGPIIAGTVFNDLDGDGSRDPDDPPFYGWLTLQHPDSVTATTATQDGGTYHFPVQHVGLYTLTYEPPALDCDCEVVVTTPNPLQVMLLAGADGQPQSYLHADFGARIIRLEEPMPIVLTPLPPGSIRQDPWKLLDIALAEGLMTLRVEFSGCTPFHDFTLFMSGGWMESNPVQARLVLGHDSHGEACLAVFARTLHFDLAPLRAAFEQAYGTPGPVLLRLVDLQGNHHEFLHAWGPSPGGNLLPNGSFEENGQPSLAGWEVISPSLTALVPEPAPGGGSWALQLEADWAPTRGFVRALVPGFIPGETLRLSAWVRAAGLMGGGMMYLSTGTWISAQATSMASEWTQIILVATPPVAPGDSLWVVLSSLHTEIAPRVGLFDRVVLERSAGPSEKP